MITNYETSNIQTPFYFYDMELLTQTLDIAKNAADKYGYKIHYSIKANNKPEILNTIRNYGFGADCVSGNEILAALEEGFLSSEIVFAGVGKTAFEIKTAINNNIAYFNVESIQELELINQTATKLKKHTRVSIRINPDIDAKTHSYITTGTKLNKFGVSTDEFDEFISIIRASEYVQILGLHFHIGSQITDFNVFKALAETASEYVNLLEQKGVNIKVLNLGGGLGINYKTPQSKPIANFNKYFDTISNALNINKSIKVHFELGRSLVGQCGSLISSVLYIKKRPGKNFAIIDAGMTDLMRPALYGAEHKIEKIPPSTQPLNLVENYDIVGPICESSDTFGKEITIEKLHQNDRILIHSCGAYGEVMTSNYNLRNKPGSYLSSQLSKIKKRV